MLGLIHTFLNFAAPPFTLFSLFFFFIPFQFLKFFLSILRTFSAEDVADKVVLITGASSGIGECLAYEYAKRGACLVITARREANLREVAEKARDLGSPDVIIVCADVAKVGDCRRVVDQTMNHFGRLDHLVNNVATLEAATLEEVNDVTDFRVIMDVSFWGFVYMTKFALPHLRKSGGRIVVLSSSAAWIPTPRMGFYNASKAAVSQFFETLRVEIGSEIGITLVTPGYIESELARGKFVCVAGKLEFDEQAKDARVGLVPVFDAEKCVKDIVQGAVRGERYVTEPAWIKMTYLWKLFFPEVVDWVIRVRTGSGVCGLGKKVMEVVDWVIGVMTGSGEYGLGKKVTDYKGAKSVLYPEKVQGMEAKTG